MILYLVSAVIGRRQIVQLVVHQCTKWMDLDSIPYGTKL